MGDEGRAQTCAQHEVVTQRLESHGILERGRLRRPLSVNLFIQSKFAASTELEASCSKFKPTRQPAVWPFKWLRSRTNTQLGSPAMTNRTLARGVRPCRVCRSTLFPAADDDAATGCQDDQARLDRSEPRHGLAPHDADDGGGGDRGTLTDPAVNALFVAAVRDSATSRLTSRAAEPRRASAVRRRRAAARRVRARPLVARLLDLGASASLAPPKSHAGARTWRANVRGVPPRLLGT